MGAFLLKKQLKQPFSLVRLYLKLAVVARIRSTRTEKLRQENRLVDGYPELERDNKTISFSHGQNSVSAQRTLSTNSSSFLVAFKELVGAGHGDVCL